MSSEVENALIGRTIGGKYLIATYLGGGAMGAVYKARQTSLEKTVAIKVMHRRLAVDELFAARFHREARAASRLDHPSSIRVFDFGEEPDGLLYIAMELCEGRDLHAVMTDAFPLGDARVVDMLAQVLAALAVAHEMGVVHRDLKPENILVQAGVDDEGRPTDVVKVCDFGIATIAEPRSDKASDGAVRSNITGTGFIIGTPEYMSPEQARGEPVDARSDLYSAGIVLFRMITGALPFVGESALGVAVKHIFEAPARPSQVFPGVNPHLEAVCLKALQKKPENRYQSAREMRADLRAAVATGERLSSVTPERSSTAPTSLRRASSAPRGPRGATAFPTLPGLAAPSPEPRRLPRLAPILAAGVAVAAITLGWASRSSRAPAPPVVTASTRIEAPTTPRIAALDPPPSGAAPPAEPDAIATNEPRSGEPRSIVRGSLLTPLGAAQPPRIVRPSASASPELVVTATPTPTPAPEPVVAAPAQAPLSVAPTPTPAPAAPALDVAAAHVVIGGVSTTNGLPGSSVRSALGRASFSGCYQAALRAAGAPAGGAVNLHLAIDTTGHVTSATAVMGFLPGARACVESAARSLRISNVDTGDATADVALSFLPR